MAQKSGDHQLRLVVYPIVYGPGFSTIPSGYCSRISGPSRLTQPSCTLKKKIERLIFPTKYVIPKSLSRLAIGQVRRVGRVQKNLPVLQETQGFDPVGPFRSHGLRWRKCGQGPPPPPKFKECHFKGFQFLQYFSGEIVVVLCFPFFLIGQRRWIFSLKGRGRNPGS